MHGDVFFGTLLCLWIWFKSIKNWRRYSRKPAIMGKLVIAMYRLGRYNKVMSVMSWWWWWWRWRRRRHDSDDDELIIIVTIIIIQTLIYTVQRTISELMWTIISKCHTQVAALVTPSNDIHHRKSHVRPTSADSLRVLHIYCWRIETSSTDESGCTKGQS